MSKVLRGREASVQMHRFFNFERCSLWTSAHSDGGREMTFQVCHLSHFYITLKLAELLSLESRVIILSSESHRYASLPAAGLTRENLSPSTSSTFSSMSQYNNAKLCNVLFAHELARRWRSKGICVFVLHPGNMVSSRWINCNFLIFEYATS